MNKYAKAYTEVYEILSYLKKEDYDKIPEEIITAIKENRDVNYVYEMNEDIDLESQEMLRETKAILFNLFRDYLCTEEQRETIIAMQAEERYNLSKKQEETKVGAVEFNFSKIEEKEIKDKPEQQSSLIEIEEKHISLFERIKTAILKLFKK